jgi:hypothetical protein
MSNPFGGAVTVFTSWRRGSGGMNSGKFSAGFLIGNRSTISPPAIREPETFSPSTSTKTLIPAPFHAVGPGGSGIAPSLTWGLTSIPFGPR